CGIPLTLPATALRKPGGSVRRRAARKMSLRSPGAPVVTENDRPGEPGAGVEGLQRPAAVVSSAIAHAQDPGRLPGDEGHVEGAQRIAEPVAERLDEGFLARPAIEESDGPLERIQVAV